MVDKSVSIRIEEAVIEKMATRWIMKGIPSSAIFYGKNRPITAAIIGNIVLRGAFRTIYRCVYGLEPGGRFNLFGHSAFSAWTFIGLDDCFAPVVPDAMRRGNCL